ncbi:C-type lectin lectoxin-Thr1 [Microcaecilia unicolor]|uniref:C-type lectin lectoxin-Thr1-like n=1 Tax=Microcaecilia unicolor TaxID=1415580 RepID=A0A6P7XRR3_9AMPH|nr:C-type lectin lectoxin-Thr1-like [Microcaecilia unicolor]
MKESKATENVYMNNFELKKVKTNNEKVKKPMGQVVSRNKKGRDRNSSVILYVLLVISLLLWVILGTVAFLKYSKISEELEKLQMEYLDIVGNVSVHLAEVRLEQKEARNDMQSALLELQNNTESACRCCRCKRGWDWIEGSCYFFSTDTQTWEGAKQFCSSKGSHLLILKENELTYLLEYIDSYHYWIGLKKDTKGWTWTDGNTVKFSKWAPGEPNGGNNQNICVEMHPNGNWNDHDCSAKRNWICEMEPKDVHQNVK